MGSHTVECCSVCDTGQLSAHCTFVGFIYLRYIPFLQKYTLSILYSNSSIHTVSNYYLNSVWPKAPVTPLITGTLINLITLG